MNHFYKVLSLILFISALNLCRAEGGVEEKNTLVPSHADAAVILAKYSGLFDRYISPDTSLNGCVAFLNEQGIYFGLMEVVNGAEFTVKDCARVMGQIELLFSAEADFWGGKVLLPKGIASWEEFCIMQGVDYVEGYQAVLDTLRSAHQLNK